MQEEAKAAEPVKMELNEQQMEALREGWFPVDQFSQPQDATRLAIADQTIATLQSRVLWLLAQQSEFINEINSLRRELALLRNKEKDTSEEKQDQAPE